MTARPLTCTSRYFLQRGCCKISAGLGRLPPPPSTHKLDLQCRASGNRGTARERVDHEVHRGALQHDVRQFRKLDEEERNHEARGIRILWRFRFQDECHRIFNRQCCRAVDGPAGPHPAKFRQTANAILRHGAQHLPAWPQSDRGRLSVAPAHVARRALPGTAARSLNAALASGRGKGAEAGTDDNRNGTILQKRGESPKSRRPAQPPTQQGGG